MSHRLIHGDCTNVLRDLARDGLFVDSVVTDPPYHFASIVDRLGDPGAAPIQSGATGAYARASKGFMGQTWDGGDVAFRVDTWRRVFDVMKPGAHLFAFAATKGYHRIACAIEDAGFEIRDMVPWLYGTGFPKSHNLDGEWQGWGSALKPAIEPVVMAQKPISEGSIEENVRRWGVGAIWIDGCRIPATDDFYVRNCSGQRGQDQNRERSMDFALTAGIGSDIGRFPANLCHDGSVEVLEAFPITTSGTFSGKRNMPKTKSVFGKFELRDEKPHAGSTGSAARFFYSSKATQGERIFECRTCGQHKLGKLDCRHEDIRTHPTVKPISLMRWYVRMITPPSGLVLDPFAGTGTTAEAARAEGFQSLSIEADANHCRDIGVRLGINVADLLVADVKAHPTNHGDQMDMFA